VTALDAQQALMLALAEQRAVRSRKLVKVA